MLPTRKEAIELVHDGLLSNPGPWGKHCLTAAHCAEKIASECDGMVVKDPIGIVSQLYFDSFVLHVDNDQIGACISNDKLMFGHFIDATWNFDWKLVSLWINKLLIFIISSR